MLVAARLRDWPIALELTERAVDHLHWVGDRPQLAGVLNVVARAVVDEDPEAAAVLQGAARRLAVADLSAADLSPPAVQSQAAPGAGGGLIGELRRETTGMLDVILGGERRRELRAVGEAMNLDRTATYALDTIRANRGAG